MEASDRKRKMLARTQGLMAVVSLIPLVVLLYISAKFVFGPLQQQGEVATIYGLFATLLFTAVIVLLGYIVVRNDTLDTIATISEGERRLDRLREATAALAAIEHIDEARRELVARASGLIGGARVALWSREGDDLKITACVGLDEAKAIGNPLPVGSGVVGKAAEDGATLLDPALGDTDTGWDDRVGSKTVNALLVPLTLGGETTAVLDLRNKDGGFSPVDRGLAEGLAQQAALLLDNARFRDAQAGYASAVAELVRDITHQHLTWPGHVDNVRALCQTLADGVNLPPDKRAALDLAVDLHDIGLLDFPKVDIGPPGGPVDHAEKGAARLAAMPFWAEAAPIVRCHHELMDGRGPLGKRGFAIPMGARILSLAEYIDTVTNPGSPWGRKTVEQVVDELKASDDKRFDPRVVAAFLKAQGGSDEIDMDDSMLDRMEVVSPVEY